MNHRLLIFFAVLASLCHLMSAGQEAAADPLWGAWRGELEGDDLRLTLHPDGNAEIDGLAATWRRFGTKKLRFEVDGKVQRPKFTLVEGALTVHWEDGVIRYTRATPSFPKVPPALKIEGPPKGKTKTWTHPKGYFTCELPHRWRVEAIDEWLMVVDPGLEGKETLEAIVFVGWGELEDNEKGKTPVQLMQRYEGEWLRLLRADGLRLRKAKTAPRRVLVGDVPGAEQEWSGAAKNGEKIRLWAGSIVKRDAFLYVAALSVTRKEPEYFPKAKQLFLSVIPTPPERNRKLEQLLAGKMITSTVNNDSGGTGWRYSFHDDGSLDSFWYLTGVIGLDIADTSQQEWGSYEVFGNALYIYLKSGQVEGQIELDRAGQPVAILLKGGRYPL